MADVHYYQTIAFASAAEFKDRGSRFLAYAFPVADVKDFKQQLVLLKEEHPKAAHHCFAYRIGTNGNVFRAGDDGEPSGSAGKPILGQIDSFQLTNVLVVVVRYFGGTLLGVPGLINAYKTVASSALQSAKIINQAILQKFQLQFDYMQVNDVMKIIKQTDCVIHSQEIQLFCNMEIGIPLFCKEQVLQRLQDLRSIEIKPLDS